MALPLPFRARPPRRTARPDPAAPPPAGPAAVVLGAGGRVPVVHRLGAVVVAGAILVFGLLGFAGGLAYFSTRGEPIAGLSSNGLLSTISVATAAVLIAAALSGPRPASTAMMVVGGLFLASALANLAVLDGPYNLLAFRLPNVFFSVGAGLTLLLLGAYGRVSGNLPADSPYARPIARTDDDGAAECPSTPAEFAAEWAMRAAEVAVVQHVASFDQRRRVAAMAAVHTRAERRRVWMEFDRAPSAPRGS